MRDIPEVRCGRSITAASAKPLEGKGEERSFYAVAKFRVRVTKPDVRGRRILTLAAGARYYAMLEKQACPAIARSQSICIVADIRRDHV